ncbi:MAG: cysteine dioxygenase [Stackebrandtia sp.]
MTVFSRRRVDHLAVARDHVFRRGDWPTQPQFDPDDRWYARIAETSDYEVWLLSWMPGQGTDLHDHGDSAGAFTVVSGELVELTPEAANAGEAPKLTERTLGAGRGHRFGRRYIHQVTNRGVRPAVSVHVYGPALKTMTRYEMTDEGLRVIAVDLEGAQW